MPGTVLSTEEPGMRKTTRDVKVIQWLIQKFRNQQGFGIDMRTEMKV